MALHYHTLPLEASMRTSPLVLPAVLFWFVIHMKYRNNQSFSSVAHKHQIKYININHSCEWRERVLIWGSAALMGLCPHKRTGIYKVGEKI